MCLDFLENNFTMTIATCQGAFTPSSHLSPRPWMNWWLKERGKPCLQMNAVTAYSEGLCWPPGKCNGIAPQLVGQVHRRVDNSAGPQKCPGLSYIDDVPWRVNEGVAERRGRCSSRHGWRVLWDGPWAPLPAGVRKVPLNDSGPPIHPFSERQHVTTAGSTGMADVSSLGDSKQASHRLSLSPRGEQSTCVQHLIPHSLLLVPLLIKQLPKRERVRPERPEKGISMNPSEGQEEPAKETTVWKEEHQDTRQKEVLCKAGDRWERYGQERGEDSQSGTSTEGRHGEIDTESECCPRCPLLLHERPLQTQYRERPAITRLLMLNWPDSVETGDLSPTQWLRSLEGLRIHFHSAHLYG